MLLIQNGILQYEVLFDIFVSIKVFPLKYYFIYLKLGRLTLGRLTSGAAGKLTAGSLLVKKGAASEEDTKTNSTIADAANNRTLQ